MRILRVVLLFGMAATAGAQFLQIIQQGSKLIGTGASGGAQLGSSAALSADGNTMAVGGSSDNGPAWTRDGAVWIFVRNAGIWTQQGQKLIGSNYSTYAAQGFSVALSADGDTLAVGGQGDNEGAGAVWMWTRTAGIWSQQGEKLVGSGASNPAWQGATVALSADGGTLAVGGPSDTYNSNAGAVWIWTRTGGVWTQQGSRLAADDATPNARQGSTVALSLDGNTLAVGGMDDSDDLGAAWAWTRADGVWTQQGGKLVGNGAVGLAMQGASVALSANGNTLIAGSLNDDWPYGATWVWLRTDGVWKQQGKKLFASDAIGWAKQGWSVAISGDGDTAVVSGMSDNNNIGAIWAWSRSHGVWTQQGPKTVGTGSTGSAPYQGSSLAISTDGITIAVGATNDGGSVGAVWAYTIKRPPAWRRILTTVTSN